MGGKQWAVGDLEHAGSRRRIVVADVVRLSVVASKRLVRGRPRHARRHSRRWVGPAASRAPPAACTQARARASVSGVRVIGTKGGLARLPTAHIGRRFVAAILAEQCAMFARFRCCMDSEA